MRAFSNKLDSSVQPMRQSMTTTQGSDGRRTRLIEQTGVAVCFCDPHSPWQRGSNENTRAGTATTVQGTDLIIAAQNSPVSAPIH